MIALQVDIVVATPGRLDDLISSGILSLANVRFFILDEAVSFFILIPMVLFKRLGSQCFHELFNQYICFFSKHYGYCKTGSVDIFVNFSRFFKQHSLHHFS